MSARLESAAEQVRSGKRVEPRIDGVRPGLRLVPAGLAQIWDLRSCAGHGRCWGIFLLHLVCSTTRYDSAIIPLVFVPTHVSRESENEGSIRV